MSLDKMIENIDSMTVGLDDIPRLKMVIRSVW